MRVRRQASLARCDSARSLAARAPSRARRPPPPRDASEAVQFLNQQRAANGIPANLTFDNYLTTGCKNHNAYMEQNGLRHGEDPSKPGYTPEGADYTNIGEVLAQGITGWTASTNPWDTAPLHQTILFDPQVNSAGYDEDRPVRLHAASASSSSRGRRRPSTRTRATRVVRTCR